MDDCDFQSLKWVGGSLRYCGSYKTALIIGTMSSWAVICKEGAADG